MSGRQQVMSEEAAAAQQFQQQQYQEQNNSRGQGRAGWGDGAAWDPREGLNGPNGTVADRAGGNYEASSGGAGNNRNLLDNLRENSEFDDGHGIQGSAQHGAKDSASSVTDGANNQSPRLIRKIKNASNEVLAKLASYDPAKQIEMAKQGYLRRPEKSQEDGIDNVPGISVNSASAGGSQQQYQQYAAQAGMQVYGSPNSGPSSKSPQPMAYMQSM